MTEIDRALAGLREAPDDQKAISGFYDLFLNSTFYVPTVSQPAGGSDDQPGQEQEVPLVLEADGLDYLVFFDQRERLDDWAGAEADCVELQGHALAEISPEGLNWAMNIGTDHNKHFTPDEIAWLKEVVTRCEAEAGE